LVTGTRTVTSSPRTGQVNTNAANLQRVVQGDKALNPKRATGARKPAADSQRQIASRDTAVRKPQVQRTPSTLTGNRSQPPVAVAQKPSNDKPVYGPVNQTATPTAKEAAPPKLPVPKDDSTSDTNLGSWQAANREANLNSEKTGSRGRLIDVKPHTTSNNGFDNNSNFKRVEGTADSSKLPVYQIKDKANSFVMPIDLKKVSLAPSADRSADGKNVPTSQQPNPLYTTQTVADHSETVMAGKKAGIDPKKYMGAFNSAFFNSYRPDTTLSYSTLVNGEVTSTGKVEPGKKLLLSWDNKTGASSLTPWKANTEGGFESTTTAGKKVTLASPDAVKKSFGSLVGNKDANGFVGTDAKSLMSDPEKSKKSERGTYVGTNGKGNMAVLVAGDNMTAKEVVDTFSSAGYKSNVIKLDSGPSSQLSLVTNRQSTNFFTGAKTDSRDAENMFNRDKGRETPLPINIISK
jgi:hypothetical protein